MHKKGMQHRYRYKDRHRRPIESHDSGCPGGCRVELLCSKAINAAEPLLPSLHCSCILVTHALRVSHVVHASSMKHARCRRSLNNLLLVQGGTYVTVPVLQDGV